MGPHANEGEQSIFDRKQEDIQKEGVSFWISKTMQGKNQLIEKLVKKSTDNNESAYVIFIAPSQKGGAKDTKTEDVATGYSKDQKKWVKMPKKLSPLTGLINKNTCSLIFDEIITYPEEENKYLNLWEFCEFENQEKPIKFHLGRTAVCSQLGDTSNKKDKLKNNMRKVVGIARLKADLPVVYIKKD